MHVILSDESKSRAEGVRTQYGSRQSLKRDRASDEVTRKRKRWRERVTIKVRSEISDRDVLVKPIVCANERYGL
ncbi:hypothetical protein Mapa_004367 [Marchantia paleacea]|nr:hypothetical protein Mapa_004367 [Marchantia paleacea]